MHRAQSLDRENCEKVRIEFVTLLSIKNGGCAQDCGYCPQTAHCTGTQAGCFLATTDEIFYARKLLTIGNPDTKANDMPLRRESM